MTASVFTFRAEPPLHRKALIVHVYPAWTRGSYSSSLLAELARLPHVAAFKMGEREMNKYARDIEEIREADAHQGVADVP
jgi:4-hydroxy-tetrahydrodipicolinate synthase